MSESIALGDLGSLAIALETYAAGAIVPATTPSRLLWGESWVFSFDEPLQTFENVQTNGTLENAPISDVKTNARATLSRSGVLDLAEVPMCLMSAFGAVADDPPSDTTNTHLFLWQPPRNGGLRPATWGVWGIDRDTTDPQKVGVYSIDKLYCTEFGFSVEGQATVQMTASYSGANPQRLAEGISGLDAVTIAAEQFLITSNNATLVSGSSRSTLLGTAPTMEVKDVNSISVTCNTGNVEVNERNGRKDFSYTRVRNGKRMMTLSMTVKVNLEAGSLYQRLIAAKKDPKHRLHMGLLMRGDEIETVDRSGVEQTYHEELLVGATFVHTPGSMAEVGTVGDAGERTVSVELRSIDNADGGMFARLQTKQADYPA